MSLTDDSPMLEVILDEIRELKTRVTLVDEAIRGNGKPGINQQLAVAVADLEAFKREIKRDRTLVAGAFALGLPIAWDTVKRWLGWH